MPLEEEERIIQMRSRLYPQPVTQDQRYCRHNKITVVESMRLLVCMDCKLWIDPFDYLMRWATRDWAAERRLVEYEAKMRDVAAKVEKLKIEEGRLRSRLYHWRKREREKEKEVRHENKSTKEVRPLLEVCSDSL